MKNIITPARISHALCTSCSGILDATPEDRETYSREWESSHSDLCNNISTEFTSAPGNRDILIKKFDNSLYCVYTRLYLHAALSRKVWIARENQLLSCRERGRILRQLGRERKWHAIFVKRTFRLLSKKTLDSNITADSCTFRRDLRVREISKSKTKKQFLLSFCYAIFSKSWI